MGMKKNTLLAKNYLPEKFYPVLDFLSSMKYTLAELKNLTPLEVEFLRTRCIEERIEYLDEVLERITGIIYDEKGDKRIIKNSKTSMFQRKRVILQYDGKIFPSKNALARYIGKSSSYIDARLKDPNSKFKLIDPSSKQ